ncbi:hypothetical protein FOS38_13430 [Lactobacillus rhamnosus]|nr:hypothetical protein [Lacticaseibacillus rhamnosus]QPB48479.1 hypothetical protein GFB59_12055 [Lacticaseibacillus rhamnosus]
MMAGFWPLRPRSLHAGFWAGERVMTSANQLVHQKARQHVQSIIPRGDNRRPRCKGFPSCNYTVFLINLAYKSHS